GVLRVTFTSRGGAVEKIELLREKASVGKVSANVVFNAANAEAALTLAVQNPASRQLESVRSEFLPAGADAGSGPITFVGVLADGTKVERTYSLAAASDPEPHLLRFTTRLVPSAKDRPAPRFWISSGSWEPTAGDSVNQFLSVLVHDGEELTRVGLDVFTDSSGFFGLGAHRAETEHAVAAAGRVHGWVASGNQFFASIIRPDPAARGARSDILVRPVAMAAGGRGVDAYASWETPAGADLVVTQPGELYVGPKEYARVSALADSQVEVLQFSKLFGFIPFDSICKLLLACLGGVHHLLDWSGAWSWGWAIVALTVILKAVTWPLTAAQQRAAKKMQKFSKPMQDIRERHKDNPEKMQKELMKLYQEHKINPFAGCLPVLIQIPIFFGLYTAFQTTVELRLHSFLWIADLSAPDTVAHVAGFPLNPLPVLMGLTMWLSMRMTPTPQADPSQKLIFNLMAVFFPIICYPMASALTLYMTVQNLLTMLQSAVTKDESAAETRPAKG
ncbi:MAG: membrane protein insertase YidC, partial [Opitutia bacterium]